jgi:hypothetical protein
MSNFVSNSDATTLFKAVGKKKLTVTDTMPTAAAGNVGVSYLYLGADTQDFEEGGVYKCQEVTPATDPKTYEYAHVFTAKVDLSLYKRIFGGTVDAWDLLTDDQKAQYDYAFFDDDADNYLTIVDTVEDGNMHAVTSNAVAEEVEDLDAEISDVVNYYGAKNMISTPYYSEDGLESNGITYTVNPDGSVTANGTATANSTFYYFHNIKGSACQFINGCIFSKLTDGSNNTFFMSINATLDPWTPYCRLTNEGEKVISGIPNDDTLVDGIIRIASGTTVTNKTFYPMIRKPEIKDDTYVPYAMTNKQLTDVYGNFSRRFNIIIQNTFGSAQLPDDWKTGYRFIYVIMNYSNMTYLLQPTVLPTESLAIGRPYAISYYDGSKVYLVTFSVSSDNIVTLSKYQGGELLVGAWFCLVR